ncbi:MAG: hypothetical protein HAW65_01815, partial [Alphaproteobacteria bacterium]|nr:hypothetical protein [Alphaproteobacteria bacterium]
TQDEADIVVVNRIVGFNKKAAKKGENPVPEGSFELHNLPSSGDLQADVLLEYLNALPPEGTVVVPPPVEPTIINWAILAENDAHSTQLAELLATYATSTADSDTPYTFAKTSDLESADIIFGYDISAYNAPIIERNDNAPRVPGVHTSREALAPSETIEFKDTSDYRILTSVVSAIEAPTAPTAPPPLPTPTVEIKLGAQFLDSDGTRTIETIDLPETGIALEVFTGDVPTTATFKDLLESGLLEADFNTSGANKLLTLKYVDIDGVESTVNINTTSTRDSAEELATVLARTGDIQISINSNVVAPAVNNAPVDIVFNLRNADKDITLEDSGTAISVADFFAVDSDDSAITYTLKTGNETSTNTRLNNIAFTDSGFAMLANNYGKQVLQFTGDKDDYADNEWVRATIIATDTSSNSYEETIYFQIDDPDVI